MFDILEKDLDLKAVHDNTFPNLNKTNNYDKTMSYKELMKRQYHGDIELDERGAWYLFFNPGPEIVRMIYNYSYIKQWPNQAYYIDNMNDEFIRGDTCLYHTVSPHQKEHQISYIPERIWLRYMRAIPNGYECVLSVFETDDEVIYNYKKLNKILENNQVTILGIYGNVTEKFTIHNYEDVSFLDFNDYLKKAWNKAAFDQKLILISKHNMNLIFLYLQYIRHVYFHYSTDSNLEQLHTGLSKLHSTFIYNNSCFD